MAEVCSLFCEKLSNIQINFRYWLNSIACGFVFIGVVFDIGVWYLVKDLKIFDEESIDVQMKTDKKRDC